MPFDEKNVARGISEKKKTLVSDQIQNGSHLLKFLFGN
jgi:hypothetical protein